MKIPKFKFDKLKKQEEPEIQEAHEENSVDETVVNATIEVSEATLKKVWAGEIAAAVLLAFVSVIIALMG